MEIREQKTLRATTAYVLINSFGYADLSTVRWRAKHVRELAEVEYNRPWAEISRKNKMRVVRVSISEIE